MKYIHGGNVYTDRVSSRIASDFHSFAKRFQGWQENVSFIHAGGNPFENMREVLGRVGIKTTSAKGDESSFCIKLRVQQALEIGGDPHALMGVAGSADNLSNIHLDIATTALLATAKSAMAESEGEFTMYMVDHANMSFAPEAAILALQVTSKARDSDAKAHVLGVCDVVNPSKSGQSDLYPAGYANRYFNTSTPLIDRATAVITIIQQPKHGRVEPTNGDGDWTSSRYIPNAGYIGDDSIVIQVAGNNNVVRIHYFFAVMDDESVEGNPNPICQGSDWRISVASPDSARTSDVQSRLIIDASDK